MTEAADARGLAALIAAAPELHDTLTRLLEDYDYIREEWGDDWKEDQSAIDARALLERLK